MSATQELIAAALTAVDTKDAAPEMVKGGRYNWKHQKERLIYLGRNRSGNGFWHQFAKVDSPADVWCEVVDADLHMIEKTPQPVSAAEVPMPQGYAERPSDYTGGIWIESQMRTYGDARESAGYARGLEEADKLAHALATCRSTFKKYADLHSAKGTDEGRDKAASNMRMVEICDAALRAQKGGA